MVHVRVEDRTRGTVLGDRITVAANSVGRMVGLLGKAGLNPGEGLWIKPSSGVHTIGMRFKIDVVGLDKDRRVTHLWQQLVPYRITVVSLRLRSVLELPCGRIKQCAVQLGDVIEISVLG